LVSFFGCDRRQTTYPGFSGAPPIYLLGGLTEMHMVKCPNDDFNQLPKSKGNK
jgi:hypothetical protein